MRKIYALGLVSAMVLAANAQRSAVELNRNLQITPGEFNRSTNDTLATGADWSQQATIYGVVASAGGGYLCGSNGYGDKQKVQIFYPTDVSFNPVPYTVIGAIYWFGGKTVASSGSGNVNLRVYKIDGTNGTTSSASGTAKCPNTTYVSDAVAMSAVDTAGYLADITPHTFSAPAAVTTLTDGQYAFGVGFDVSGLNMANGDTLGCVSSTDGNYDINFPESAWEQWSDNSWYSIAQAWNVSGDLFDIELAIFPIAFNTLSMDETPYLNGVRTWVASPFTNSAVFNYDLLNDAPSVTIHIMDMNGKIVYTKSITGGVQAGHYTMEFDGSSLAAGTYFMSLQAGQGRVATKFVKQ